MILQQLEQVLVPYHNATEWLVAYSGGVDSTVLLHAVQQYLTPLPVKPRLRAIHINHHLSPHATAWQQQCQLQCQHWQIPFTSRDLDLSGIQNNIEASAREGRYALLQQELKSKQSILLTAHHQEDQAETLLFRLFRGATVTSLAAMTTQRPLGQGIHLRPFLQLSKQAILTYAKQQQLQWLEDESNQQLRFDRNYIRHQVLPVIQQRWPQVITQLCQTAQHCRDAEQVLEQSLKQQLQHCFYQNRSTILDLNGVQRFTPEQQVQLIYLWLKPFKPSRTMIQTVCQQLMNAKPDANPLVRLEQAQLRRFQNRLYLLPEKAEIEVPKAQSWHFQQQPELELPGIGKLSASLILQHGLIMPPDTAIEVRFRQGGEHFHPSQRQHSCSLKHYFQEQNIEPWRRSTWPLLFCQQQLLAVCGLDVAKNWPKANSEQTGWVFEFIPTIDVVKNFTA